MPTTSEHHDDHGDHVNHDHDGDHGDHVNHDHDGHHGDHDDHVNHDHDDHHDDARGQDGLGDVRLRSRANVA